MQRRQCALLGLARSGVYRKPAPPDPIVGFVTRGKGPRVLLWGDSFAAHYVPGLKHQADQVHADILQYTLSACPPVFSFDSLSNPPCRAFNDHVVNDEDVADELEEIKRCTNAIMQASGVRPVGWTGPGSTGTGWTPPPSG